MFRSSVKQYCYDHSFCLDCIGRYVADKLGQNIIEIRCPDPDCTRLLEPQSCRSALAERVINQWEAALSGSPRGSKRSIYYYCPYDDCSSPFEAAAEDEEGNQLVAESVECPHCRRLFCRWCRVAWHVRSCKCKNMTKSKSKGGSASSGRRHEKYVNREFKSLAKKEKWKRCPGCKFYVQKKDGCEHIKCR
ncbi:E3 ubiquitin ligase RBR family [Trema orientale]|uniref:RBR-type E3 ubiquitin transferase n=1 Tax=Trema orientale TaxID=63057 RepID=A0A2P5DYE5_TREOI|nr:E3 ubiquitin ligase RBR family [Trema orientale]